MNDASQDLLNRVAENAEHVAEGGDTTAFNELWSSTEAGVGALSIFNSGADNFNSVLGSMQNSAGATSAAYDTMAGTTEYAQQRMTTAFDNLKIAIGNSLNPALERLYDTGTEAFSWATDFVNENPWVVSAASYRSGSTPCQLLGPYFSAP